MIHRKNLKVPSHIADEMVRIVNEPDSSVKGGEQFSHDVLFDDGRFMTIQVCASENPSEESCWTQGVLRERSGHEIACTVVCKVNANVGESFLGEYHIEYLGDEYIVEVVKVVKEKKIFKHTITVTIFSEEENLEKQLDPEGYDDDHYWTLADLGDYMTNGEGIGTYELTNTEPVPNDKIKDELFKIGNDGTFFDDFDENND